MSTSIRGYVRADVPLNVLDTAVRKSSTGPFSGVLEISTEDGALRIAINGEAAKEDRLG